MLLQSKVCPSGIWRISSIVYLIFCSFHFCMANQLVYIHIENIGYLCQCLQVELCVVVASLRYCGRVIMQCLCQLFTHNTSFCQYSLDTIQICHTSIICSISWHLFSPWQSSSKLGSAHLLNENVVFAAKLLLLIGNKDYIHIKLPKRVVFSQIQGI